MDSHRAPGIVAHDGKARSIIAPLTLERDTPSTPSVTNWCPAICVTPTCPEAEGTAVITSQGREPIESSPQYSAGCALKMFSPLISKTVRHTTLIQCISRTGRRWR